MAHTILLFMIWIEAAYTQQYLCVYQCNNGGYPNYCGSSCTPNSNDGQNCPLFGSQSFSNLDACNTHRNQQNEQSLHCIYNCGINDTPNYCLPSYSGQVCPIVSIGDGCPLLQEPRWFDNYDACEEWRNRPITTAPTMQPTTRPTGI